MKRRIICFLLGIHFLAGGVLFPLGDFSLMKQLPQMYANYLRVASPDEVGIDDFIGDYLLGGKDILGHNKNDVPGKSGSAVQFQSAVAFVALIPCNKSIFVAVVTHSAQMRTIPNHDQKISGFTTSLFRPPLA